jgi:[ribosomal protein S18]-alanine N-acetyltransferase
MMGLSTCVPHMFTLRDYEKRDFEALFQLDRLCFDPSIAYSRPELTSFIEQRRAFTIVAEWDGPNAAPPNGAATAEAHKPASDDTRPAPSNGRSQQHANHGPGARRPVAGFLTCHYQRQGYGHIITIDVHPEARRNHLGTLLIDAACERLRKMAAFMVVLEVAVNNHPALAFYDRFGFKRVKVLEHYYSRNIDAIFMTKRL